MFKSRSEAQTLKRSMVARLLFSSSFGFRPSFVPAALYNSRSSSSPFRFPKHTSRAKSDMASVAVAKNLPLGLATIDLSAYDPEQSKLMDERCILVDSQDRAYGASDKKTCMHPDILLIADHMLTRLQAT